MVLKSASAHCSIGCSTGIAAEFEAEVLVEALKRVRETIGSINGRVIEICVLFPEYKYLLSVPGFGPVVSAIVLAAIGDPFRFESLNGDKDYGPFLGGLKLKFEIAPPRSKKMGNKLKRQAVEF